MAVKRYFVPDSRKNRKGHGGKEAKMSLPALRLNLTRKNFKKHFHNDICSKIKIFAEI
jgi:hypothetical protein